MLDYYHTLDGILRSRNNDMFNGVDCEVSARISAADMNRTSPIHYLDNLIQNDKSSLQASELDERLHGSGVRLPTSLYLLPTLAKSRQTKVVDFFFLKCFELREEDTRYVLLLGLDPEFGLLDRLLDLEANVPADGIGDFG